MNMSPRELHCFRHVAQEGSFTAAARVLGLAQPAVSAAVKALEGRVGTPLFDRTTRQVRLTEAGVVLLEAVSAGMDRIEAGFSAVAELAAGRAGRVRLGAPPVLAAAWLPPVIAGLQSRAPHVGLDLTDGASDRLRAALKAGELDLAVGTFTQDGPEQGVRLRDVLRDRLVLAVPPGDPWTGRLEVAWTDLATRPLILVSPANGIRPVIDHAAATAAVRLKPAQEVTQIGTVLALVRAGIGPGILPSHALPLAPELATCPLVAPTAYQPIHLARPLDRAPSPAITLVERLLLKTARAAGVGGGGSPVV